MAVQTRSSPSGALTWHDAPSGSSSFVPPPKRDPSHIRFVLVSDSHNTEPDVPDGDLLLHSGDLTVLGSAPDLKRAFDWLDRLPHKYKYVIAGNHDFGLCRRDNWYETRGKELHKKYKHPITDTDEARQAVDDWERSGKSRGLVHRYLEDERVEFELGGRRWSVFGSPWTPDYESWAWNYDRGQEAKNIYADLPQTDILLTHGPPYDIGNLDHLTDGKTHVGCEELTNKLLDGQIRPLIFNCGHIHEARGIHHCDWRNKSGASFEAGQALNGPLHDETLIVNSALVHFDMAEKGFSYKVVNSAIVVDVDPGKLHHASTL